jgi:hypothetical protein
MRFQYVLSSVLAVCFSIAAAAAAPTESVTYYKVDIRTRDLTKPMKPSNTPGYFKSTADLTKNKLSHDMTTKALDGSFVNVADTIVKKPDGKWMRTFTGPRGLKTTVEAAILIANGKVKRIQSSNNLGGSVSTGMTAFSDGKVDGSLEVYGPKRNLLYTSSFTGPMISKAEYDRGIAELKASKAPPKRK